MLGLLKRSVRLFVFVFVLDERNELTFGDCRLQTPAPALYPESTLALATIYLSTRLVKPTISLPLTPVPWWSLFDSTEEELIAISRLLLTLYRDWEGENVWTKGATLPISKEGVRELIKVGTKENGNEDVNGVDDII
jgi:hypothetical protein